MDIPTTKHYWLYVLRLEQGKYYIGRTTREDPQTRIKQHKDGFYSAQWVKKYKPLDTAEIIDIGYLTKTEADRLEIQRTLQYMKKYGYQNVRGGKLNYSGKYVKILDRYFRDYEWHAALTVITLLVIMFLILLVK